MTDGILITGGTGFLGQAIVRRLLQDNIVNMRSSRICVYSRGEHAQAEMVKNLRFDGRLRMLIGDVRDRSRLEWAMRSVDTVIHAAALKRIEVGHYNPGEMVKTNIGGATNVVEAAIAAGVRRVVLVSTDKAYQPVSPYGLSKAMAESIFLAANNTVGASGPRFAVCRYGNVAGSMGSVIPRWRAEKLAGANTVTVTNPDCTRFWMTVDQAVDLVLGAVESEETLHIPRLPAFSVGDLATAMGLRMNIVGLPVWEKEHETLQDGNSSDTARRMSVEELREALTNV